MAVTKADVLTIVNAKASGFVIEVRPENLYQDTSATTPVTADGQSVNFVEDQSNHGVDFQVGSNSQTFAPTYRTDGTDHWLNFADLGDLKSTGQGLESVNSMAAAMNLNPYFVSAGLRFFAVNQLQQFFFCTRSADTTNSSDTVHIGSKDETTATIAHWGNDFDFTQQFLSNVDEVHTAKFTDPGSEYFMDGVSAGSSSTTPTSLDNTDKIGIFVRERYAGYSTPEHMAGRLYAMVCIIGDTVTAQEQADIEEWLESQTPDPVVEVNQYFTDFSEYASSAQPSDWTQRFHTNKTWTVVDDAGATGGKVLQIRGGDESRTALSWDALDANLNRDNVEVVMRVRGLTVNQDIYAMVRGTGAVATETMYRVGYRSDQQEAEIAEYVNGSFSTVQDLALASAISANTWFWVRGRANGSDLKLRWWYDTDPEPATWNIETTDTSIVSPGWVGLFQFRNRDQDIDLIGIGTNGETAPKTAPGVSGSGAMAAQRAALSGSAEVTQSHSADGSLQVQQAAFSASAVVVRTGQGSVLAEQAALSGSAEVTQSHSADGSLQAQQATLSASATPTTTGQGDLLAARATLSGFAEVTTTGQGDLLAGQVVLGVDTALTRKATPALQAAIAAIEGMGSVQSAGVAGTGAFVAEQAALTATGEAYSVLTGAGAIAAQQAALEAGVTVTSTLTGAGDLVADNAALEATGLVYVTAEGALEAGIVALDGVGIVASAIRTAEGELRAQSGEVVVHVLRTVKGSGIIGANAAVADVPVWIELHSVDGMWAVNALQDHTWSDHAPSEGDWTLQRSDWGKDL